MFSRLKKKLTTIKTDINHKIDHLEVEKNQIWNKTQRVVEHDQAINGVDYLIRKEESLNQICNKSRENEECCLKLEQSIKQSLVNTTDLFHSVRTLEKDIHMIIKTIGTFKLVIGNLEEFCMKLNNDLFQLEEIYEEKYLEDKIKNIDDTQLLESGSIEESNDILDQGDDEEIVINGQSINLKIVME